MTTVKGLAHVLLRIALWIVLYFVIVLVLYFGSGGNWLDAAAWALFITFLLVWWDRDLKKGWPT